MNNVRLRRMIRDEEGQTSVFIIGIFTVTLLVAATIWAVTVVNLEARKLLATADSVSLIAAQQFTVGGTERGPRIWPGEARAHVEKHLTDTGAHAEFENLRIQQVAVSRDNQVSVTLSATARPPIASWFLPSGVTVYAESSARTRLER